VFLTYMTAYTRPQSYMYAGQLQWARTASLVALVILAQIMGALSDRIDRKGRY
jgi:MFS family permease